MNAFQEARQWLRDWRRRVNAKLDLFMKENTRPNTYQFKDRRGKPTKGWQR